MFSENGTNFLIRFALKLTNIENNQSRLFECFLCSDKGTKNVSRTLHPLQSNKYIYLINKTIIRHSTSFFWCIDVTL
jgi:hypothetical protein